MYVRNNICLEPLVHFQSGTCCLLRLYFQQKIIALCNYQDLVQSWLPIKLISFIHLTIFYALSILSHINFCHNRKRGLLYFKQKIVASPIYIFYAKQDLGQSWSSCVWRGGKKLPSKPHFQSHFNCWNNYLNPPRSRSRHNNRRAFS